VTYEVWLERLAKAVVHPGVHRAVDFGAVFGAPRMRSMLLSKSLASATNKKPCVNCRPDDVVFVMAGEQQILQMMQTLRRMPK
jgi:hypothetical protein